MATCEDTKCKNKIFVATKCNLDCNKKFCCKNCLFNHQLEYHKSELVKKTSPLRFDNKPSRSKNIHSVFLKPGVYAREFTNNSKFEQKNFEYVKMGLVNFNLGSGAFGDVFLAKNKRDQNYYAIKKVFEYCIIL